VGNCFSRAERDLENVTAMPHRYHSVYVPGRPATDVAFGDIQEEQKLITPPVFNDTYTLLDPKLLLPTHVVEYQLDVDQARKRSQDLCDMCGQARAVVYSVQINAKTCLACDAEMHGNSYAARHSRLSLDDGSAALERDPETGAPLNRFCPLRKTCVAEDDALPYASLLTLEDAYGMMKGKMSEYELESDALKSQLAGLEETMAQYDSQVFERAAMFKQELVTYLMDYMLTLQVAEERRYELKRAITDIENMTDYVNTKKRTLTKVALLNVWKNLEPQREDLKRRLMSLAGLPGQAIVSLTLSGKDKDIDSLNRQVEHKQRIVAILKDRLKSCGATLTESDHDLLAL